MLCPLPQKTHFINNYTQNKRKREHDLTFHDLTNTNEEGRGGGGAGGNTSVLRTQHGSGLRSLQEEEML